MTNELHHLSIKRAIQVLRLNGFNPACVKRRPAPEDKNDMTEIMHWSNHRVMEWLRSIDLSEYAPNLRGSGVCGALIVREKHFHSHVSPIFSLIDFGIALQCRDVGGNFIHTDVENIVTSTFNYAFSRIDRRGFTDAQKSVRKIAQLSAVKPAYKSENLPRFVCSSTNAIDRSRRIGLSYE